MIKWLHALTEKLDFLKYFVQNYQQCRYKSSNTINGNVLLMTMQHQPFKIYLLSGCFLEIKLLRRTGCPPPFLSFAFAVIKQKGLTSA